jgi:MoxR-like ATPase
MVITLLTTFDGTRRPLVLLGHPGGGKSTFTKVLAARLPAES